jgi:hypothetical protein
MCSARGNKKLKTKEELKMEEQKETIESILTNGDHNEALLTWSENLAALGRTLRYLNEHPDPETALPLVATQLGYIIEDYANMINHLCHQAYGTIGEFFRNGKHTLVSRAREECVNRKEFTHACPAGIDNINKIIEEIKPILMEATILEESLGELEKTKKAMEQKLNPRDEQKEPVLSALNQAAEKIKKFERKT